MRAALLALGLAAAPATADEIGALGVFEACVTPRGAEETFVQDLLAAGWQEARLDGPVTLLDPEPALTPENLAAIWAMLPSDLGEHDDPERLRTLARDRNASMPGHVQRRFSRDLTALMRDGALFSISVTRHPNWTGISCAYIAPSGSEDDRLLFRDQLELRRTPLMRWVRYTDDIPPILMGFAATAAGAGLSEVIDSELPDFTLFEVRSQIDKVLEE
ncbi:MAG: hypothetical protein AAFT19_07235 [Pseudomonadota bacterium]